MRSLVKPTAPVGRSPVVAQEDGRRVPTGVSVGNLSLPKAMKRLAASVRELLGTARGDGSARLLRAYRDDLEEAIRLLNALAAEKRRLYRYLGRRVGFRASAPLLDRERAALAPDAGGEWAAVLRRGRVRKPARSRRYHRRRRGRGPWRKRRR